MKQPLNEQFRRMQKLAGIITENELKVGDTIKMPFIGSSGNQDDGKILAISTYQDNKKAIDKAIRDGGWEQQTDSSKEELTWYKIQTPDGIEWLDNEELENPEGGDEGGLGDEGEDEDGRYRSDVDWYYVDENSNYPGPKGRVIPVAAGYEDPRNFDGTELYIAQGTTGNKIGDKFEDDEGNDVEFKKEYFNSISY